MASVLHFLGSGVTDLPGQASASSSRDLLLAFLLAHAERHGMSQFQLNFPSLGDGQIVCVICTRADISYE